MQYDGVLVPVCQGGFCLAYGVSHDRLKTAKSMVLQGGVRV